jgi:nitrogen-specific signal transduction histidine kinase/FixJ family two-component response regulator
MPDKYQLTLFALICSCLFSAYLLIRNKQWSNLAQKNQQNLNAFQETKNQAISTISHEIRTPISAILGIQEKLLRNNHLDISEKTILESAHASAESMLEVLNQLLDLSKIDAGKMELKTEACNLSNLIKNISRTFSALAQKNNTAVSCHVCPEMAESLMADGTRLGQILHNLIGNAIKFSPDRKVHITTRTIANDHFAQSIYFEISDNGKGIPEAHISRIFRPFEQYEHFDTEQSQSSTGLGLTIAKQLIAMMGGRLDIDSQEGFGTSVSFTLSFKRSIKQPKYTRISIPEERIAPAITHHESVMIVDDHAPSRLITEAQFKEMGYCVHSSACGQEALNTILESSFDILVTDLTMPIINGDQLAIAAHKHYGSNIKIFGLTAHTDGAHRLLNPNNVFDFVLIKPASMRDWQQELALEKTYLMTFKDPADAQQSMLKIIASEILIYQEKSLDLLLQCLGKQQWVLSDTELKSMAHKLLGGAKLSNDVRLVKLCEQFQAKIPQPHRPLFYDLCIALTRSNKLLKKIALAP